MLFWLIPICLIVFASITVLIIVLKKIPQLRVIDVASIPKEKVRKLKQDIILDRLQRTQKNKLSKVGKTASGAVKQASKVGRRAVQKLYALEQYYEKLQKTQDTGDKSVDQKTVKRLIKEAENLVHKEEYIEAEKRYVQVISHNPKSTEAYEGLGNLYLKSKNLESARETLNFALKLSPDNASIRMSLSELEMVEDNPRAALKQLRKVIEIRPKNPKYLDAYIEMALKCKESADATEGINKMKEVNPQNKKIGEWEAKLTDLTGISTSQN